MIKKPVLLFYGKKDNIEFLKLLKYNVERSKIKEVRNFYNFNNYVNVEQYMNIEFINKDKRLYNVLTVRDKETKVIPFTYISLSPVGFINKYNYAYILFPSLIDDTELSRTHLNKYFRILHELNKVEHNGWVLDLRTNPGGLIEYFVTAICPFVKEFELITYDKNNEEATIIKSNGIKFVFKTAGNELLTRVTLPLYETMTNKKIHILIDDNTASASELITVILANNSDSTIYGKPSHGIISTVDAYETKEFTIEIPASQVLDKKIHNEKIMPDVLGYPVELMPNLLSQ